MAAEQTTQESQESEGRHAVYDETLERFVGPVGTQSEADEFRKGYKVKTGDGKAHKTSIRRVGD